MNTDLLQCALSHDPDSRIIGVKQAIKTAQWDGNLGEYRLKPPFTSVYHYVASASAEVAIKLGYKLVTEGAR